MINVIPFRPEHIHQIQNPTVDFGDTDVFNHDCVVAFSGVTEDRVVGSAGAFVIWPGVGEAWAVFASMSLQEGRQCVIETRRRMDTFMRQGNLHRLQASIVKSNIPACRFARAVGFKYEGEMVAYDASKNTCIRYAKIV